MAQIIYEIVTGSPNFTASIFPAESAPQVHNSLGVYSFDGLPDQSYILTVVDSNGCSDVHVICGLSAVLLGEFPSTTTSTTTEEITTTTTTTLAEEGLGFRLLYNWYVAADARNVAPVDCHVPTSDEFITLTYYLDPGAVLTNTDGYITVQSTIAGGYLKETGFTHWDNPNTGADNSTGFTGLGVGSRDSDDGSFGLLRIEGDFWSSTEEPSETSWGRLFVLLNFDASTNCGGNGKTGGACIRCIVDDPDYIGNITDIDGNVYETIKIGTQLWLKQDLKVTRYRDGNIIPEVTDNATWAALTTDALCAYNNDWNNV